MWDNFYDIQKVTFIIGCAAMLVLIVQVVLMIVGFGSDSAFLEGADSDGAMDGDMINDNGFEAGGLRLFSIRTAVAFLCVGSWATFSFSYILVWWAALLVGMAIGAGAAVGVAYALRALMKLQTDGSIKIENCIGKVGQVYLTIPAARSGEGKVNVLVQETLSEFSAVTDDSEPIKTGGQVKVIAVVGTNILVVEKF
jgi:hypothetical protein